MQLGADRAVDHARTDTHDETSDEGGIDVGPDRDRTADRDPVWSHDGRWLYFSSDRTGIPNIFAIEVETERSLIVPVETLQRLLDDSDGTEAVEGC